MVEASPVKFYFAKYFFLFCAFLQWVISCVLFYIYGLIFLNIVAGTLLIFLGFILVFVFAFVSEKIKRVRIGTNKFVIMEEKENIRFGWTEIKSFRLIPFINLCKVKIKGRKGSFYFFSAGDIRKGLDLLSGSTDKHSPDLSITE
jgi:hypothetical protein